MDELPLTRHSRSIAEIISQPSSGVPQDVGAPTSSINENSPNKLTPLTEPISPEISSESQKPLTDPIPPGFSRQPVNTDPTISNPTIAHIPPNTNPGVQNFTGVLSNGPAANGSPHTIVEDLANVELETPTDPNTSKDYIKTVIEALVGSVQNPEAQTDKDKSYEKSLGSLITLLDNVRKRLDFFKKDILQLGNKKKPASDDVDATDVYVIAENSKNDEEEDYDEQSESTDESFPIEIPLAIHLQASEVHD